MLQKEEIISALASKYKIIIDEDDPMITTCYLNEIILKTYIDTMEQKIHGMMETIDSINQSHQKQLQGNIDNISTMIAEKISEGVQSSKMEITEKIDIALTETLNHYLKSLLIGKKTKYLLITLNVIAIAASLGAVAASLL